MARVNLLETFLNESNLPTVNEDLLTVSDESFTEEEFLAALESVTFSEDYDAIDKIKYDASMEDSVGEIVGNSIKKGAKAAGSAAGTLMLKGALSAFDKIKEYVSDLVSGSESVNKKYRGKLKEFEEASDDLEGKEKRSIRSLSGVIYNDEKKSYITDIPKLIKSDIDFVDTVIKTIEAIDKGVDDNIALLKDAANHIDEEDFSKYVKDKINPKLTQIDEILKRNKYRGDTLYNSQITINGESDRSGLTLKYGSGGFDVKERIRTNFTPYMTSSDVKSIFTQILVLADRTEVLVDMLKDISEKYNFLTGEVHKNVSKYENDIVGSIGTKTYLEVMDEMIDSTVALLKSIDRLPRITISRNIKLLKQFTTFGNKTLDLNKKEQ